MIAMDNPVHPRVCGEHIVGLHSAFAGFGSSPRMRGTPSEAMEYLGWERFIPAYAGNTGIKLCSCGIVAVHPRVCGEHDFGV